MIARLVVLTAIPLTILQIGGCHYYVSAVPRIIISSEPFTPPRPAVSPTPAAFQLGPD